MAIPSINHHRISAMAPRRTSVIQLLSGESWSDRDIIRRNGYTR